MAEPKHTPGSWRIHPVDDMSQTPTMPAIPEAAIEAIGDVAGMRATLSDFAARRVSSAPSFADGIDAEGLKREFWHDVGMPSADGRYSNRQIETALKHLVEEVEAIARAHNPQASSGGYDPTTQPYDEPFRHTDPQRSGAAEGNEAALLDPSKRGEDVHTKHILFVGALTAADARVVDLEREAAQWQAAAGQSLVRAEALEDRLETVERERDEARDRARILGDKYNQWFERAKALEAELARLQSAQPAGDRPDSGEAGRALLNQDQINDD